MDVHIQEGEITCPENSHYESCATACPASCADSTAPLYCNQPCRESCVCNNGYILSGGRCIPLNQCGCLYQDRYFSIGEEVILNEDCSTKCRCINANTGMQCQSYQCSMYEECKIMNGVRGCYPLQYGTCWVSGDPHYSTFDQHYFDFQGTCTYTLSKYCGISDSLTNFSISVTNDNRGSTSVSWTRQVQLSIYNHQIKMSVGEYGRVKVDESVVNLPVLLESGAIHIYYTGSAATIETDFGLSLSYDWNHLVTVKLPGTYSGQLCGLCGNYNGDISDEFIMPDGSMAQNAISFGNSWINPYSPISCLATNNEPVCSAYSKSQYSSLTQCGVITNADGPFRACHSQVDGQTYFDNCIYDLCATNGDPATLSHSARSVASSGAF
ncbi:IgGFc-binding protein-like [Protopterus annectens]|uniref:IgGFc-binding protein-like n=1 Tax=Protopterus annectens TaxID=7888 RepID=UPI001CFA6B58|nr:IgGFc-binding protein-like [Protopterus annectens]